MLELQAQLATFFIVGKGVVTCGIYRLTQAAVRRVAKRKTEWGSQEAMRRQELLSRHRMVMASEDGMVVVGWRDSERLLR